MVVIRMDFEWDEAKSEQNLRQRGFGFDYAACLFEGPVLETIDSRCDYGEIRIQAIGQVGEDILFVTYTDRNGESRRIISARKANRKERLLWQSFVNP